MEKTVVDKRNGQYCSTCKFFDTVVNVEAKQVVHICRRNAPSAAAMLVMGQDPKNPGTPLPQWTQFTKWPLVGTSDWCGEFIRDRSSDH